MCYLKELFGVYSHGGNVTLKNSLVSTVMVAMLDADANFSCNFFLSSSDI